MITVEIEKQCKKIRLDIIKELGAAGSGHPGGALSAVEIVTTLYFDLMNIDPWDPYKKDRDRFIMSKGHASALSYAVLAERGYFPVEDLVTYKKPFGNLPGHPDMKRLPGIDMTTGSLGQGLAAANGMAAAARYLGQDFYIYVVMGDGEVQEGMVWEAAMAAAHYQFDHIIAFVDRNRLQIDGPTEGIMKVEPLAEKWKAFGWNTVEIDGHNVEAIREAVLNAKKSTGKPSMIIADTTKGKGVSYMENKVEWHGKAPTGELLTRALKELEV